MFATAINNLCPLCWLLLALTKEYFQQATICCSPLYYTLVHTSSIFYSIKEYMKIYWSRIYYIIWFKSNSWDLPTLLITLGNMRKKSSFFILKRSTYSSLRYLSSFFLATETWCSISIIACILQASRRTSIHWNFNCVWLLIWKKKSNFSEKILQDQQSYVSYWGLRTLKMSVLW